MRYVPVYEDESFNNMNWHDSHIYSINFPDNNQIMELDIDYILDWKLNELDGLYNFLLAPCTLQFFDVLNLKLDLSFQNTVGLNILALERKESSEYFEKNFTIWDYEIITDKGTIQFESSGYKQIVKQQPSLHTGQMLGRLK